MSAKEILIPLMMVGLTISLNAIINTKIRFAPTAAHAIADIKKTLLYVAFWLAQLYFVWSLISQFASDAPLTKSSLASVLILSFGLFHTYLMYWLNRILRVIERIVDAQKEHVAITKELTDATKAQPNKSLQATAAVPASSKPS